VPLYMNVHNIEGSVATADGAKAHEADLSVQVSHGVHYRNNRVDERAGKILCLVEAPTAESAADVHREAHRLVADETFEVSEG
jgi:hypothetical protein